MRMRVLSLIAVAAIAAVSAPANIINPPSAGGGVTNTGNATAADVAAGKTFSSATLTNVAGTSTTNATVPSDWMHPPQAFIDNANYLADLYLNQVTDLDLSNKGITFIDSGDSAQLSGIAKFAVFASSVCPSCFTINLSGNAIADTDTLLTNLAQLNNSDALTGGTIDISGGTNAVPTLHDALVSGAGTAEVDGLYASGFGSYTQFPESIYSFYHGDRGLGDGMRWYLTGGSFEYAYGSTADAVSPWLVTWEAIEATAPAPTVTSINAARQALIDAGWTVTTN